MSPPSSQEEGTPALPAAASAPASQHPLSASSADFPDSTPMSSSESVSSSEGEARTGPARKPRPLRPKLGSRGSSGTMIVPRDYPNIEGTESEEYDEDDARTMSPRRSSTEIERMDRTAREALIEQAKALQQSLLEIVDRVESVKSEHEKLEGGNRFLQSYIGELMQTSKITSTGAAKQKGKGRNAK